MICINLSLAIKTVPEGMAYTVERYGRYLKTINPGLNFIIPIVDRIGYRVNMRERKVRVTFLELKTRDNQEIVADADIYAVVTDAYTAAYDKGDVDEALRHGCALAMSKLIKSMTLKEVMDGADALDERLLGAIKPREMDWGMQVRYVDIHKIYPST